MALASDFRSSTSNSPLLAPLPLSAVRSHIKGLHKSNIIVAQLEVLKANGWIRKCSGPWGSSIDGLAAKPHQEHVLNINDFTWSIYVNHVTLLYEYPIPCCNEAFDNFGDSAGQLCYISLNNKTGYHQIVVCYCNQGKLAFFVPDNSKWCFGIIPFGPQNRPMCYTSMMRIFKSKWQILYRSCYTQLIPLTSAVELLSTTFFCGLLFLCYVALFVVSAPFSFSNLVG